ncbi:MAG: ECF transporter S component [Oscillospiraceae bacterium]|nr:ECF transporter S component [Oscillospiraceae bacterium]
MRNSKSNKRGALWITRTAAMIALLIALQWATSGTQAFAGQYITGTLVNCVLPVSVMLCGISGGLVVAAMSPFFAFFLGIGPKLLQIVPCIAVGNVVYVVLLHLFLRQYGNKLWKNVLGVLLAAAAKFVTLYLAVVKIFIPVMGAGLKAPQIQTFTAMFSWPQLATALLGGLLALLILPVLHRAIRK